MILSGAACGSAAQPGTAAAVGIWMSADTPRTMERANAIVKIFFITETSLFSKVRFLGLIPSYDRSAAGSSCPAKPPRNVATYAVASKTRTVFALLWSECFPIQLTRGPDDGNQEGRRAG